MLYYNNFYDTLIILFTYIILYNISLLLLFWTLMQFVNINFKTIYSFNDFKFNFFFTTTTTIVLFSIAGVPPFIGFFSKLLILLVLVKSNFFFLYFFFFILLFFGLYFYIQNIRFLYSTGLGKISYSYQNNIRTSLIFINYAFFILFLITGGFLFIDDIFFILYWMLS